MKKNSDKLFENPPTEFIKTIVESIKLKREFQYSDSGGIHMKFRLLGREIVYGKKDTIVIIGATKFFNLISLAERMYLGQCLAEIYKEGLPKFEAELAKEREEALSRLREAARLEALEVIQEHKLF